MFKSECYLNEKISAMIDHQNIPRAHITTPTYGHAVAYCSTLLFCQLNMRQSSRLRYFTALLFSVILAVLWSVMRESISMTKSENVTFKKTLLLTSTSNPFRVSNVIFTSPQIWNPALLHLPNFEYLLIARLPKRKKELIDGKNYTVSQLSAGIAVVNETSKEINYVGDFLTLEYTKGVQGRLVVGCWKLVIGIEDPRLIWSPEGSPLLIFGTESTDSWSCRTCWIVDPRYFIPLDNKLGENPPPKLFPEPVELTRKGRPTRFDKNWSPFYAPDHLGLTAHRLYFHAQMEAPRVWYLNETSGKMNPLVPDDDYRLEQCITAFMEGGSLKVHHATPLLSVVLCKRGECKPDGTNTILVAIIHDQHKNKGRSWYRPYAITWFGTYPFQFKSISPRLLFSGLGAQMTYTTSMNWKRKEGVDDLSVGYLDDIVMITIGLDDEKSFYLDFPIQNLLKDHHMCGK